MSDGRGEVLPIKKVDAVDEETAQQDEVAHVASEWVIRHGGCALTAKEGEAFQIWLAADPAHQTAFAQAQEDWSKLDVLRGEPGSLRKVIAPPTPNGSRLKIIVLVTLMTSTILAGLQRFGEAQFVIPADEQTTIGETRTLRLPDGSSVELGAASAIAVKFDVETRRVLLLSGEAVFTVAARHGKDARPFVVVAEHGRTTALGTRFVVEDLGDSVVVTAIEHSIEVAMPTARGETRKVLTPGGAVTYNDAGIGPLAMVDAADATAWTRGMLVFDGLPLNAAVAKLNRYRRGRIIVMNGSLARRRVSGVFPTRHLDQAVETISSELSARTLSLPFVTILY